MKSTPLRYKCVVRGSGLTPWPSIWQRYADWRDELYQAECVRVNEFIRRDAYNNMIDAEWRILNQAKG